MNIGDFFKRKLKSLTNQDRIPVQTSTQGIQYVEFDTLKEQILEDTPSLPPAFSESTDVPESYATGNDFVPFKRVFGLGSFSEKAYLTDTTSPQYINVQEKGFWFILNSNAATSYSIILGFNINDRPTTESSRRVFILNEKTVPVTVTLDDAIFYVKSTSQGNTLTIPAETTYECIMDDFRWNGKLSLSFVGSYRNNNTTPAPVLVNPAISGMYNHPTGDFPETIDCSVYSGININRGSLSNLWPRIDFTFDTTNLQVNNVYDFVIVNNENFDVEVNLLSGSQFQRRGVFSTSVATIPSRNALYLKCRVVNTGSKVIFADVTGISSLEKNLNNSDKLAVNLNTASDSTTLVDYSKVSGVLISTNSRTTYTLNLVSSVPLVENQCFDFYIANYYNATVRISTGFSGFFIGTNSASNIDIPANKCLILKGRVNFNQLNCSLQVLGFTDIPTTFLIP